nr:integrase, catalytic region, zinc finger, CCHC-type, peptidase aspartic, catalytic [Tanacetum cinerariifolium]
MLDRTDFASWQQCIRLYCRGKEYGVNILKSIDEGPYQMGTVREPLAEGTEGVPQFGPERPRVYSDLSLDEKYRYNADIRATNILLQGLPKDIYTLINHYTDTKDIWDNHKGESIHDYYVRFAKLINDIRNIKITMSRMQLNSKFVNNMLPEWGRKNRGQGMNPRGGGVAGYKGVQNRVGNNSKYYKDKMLLTHAQKNRVALDAEQLLFLAGRHDNAFDDDVDEQLVQDLALNVDNVFQADDCDMFDSDVDEAPMAQTMFMANLSSADPVTDEARPSYDSNILSEVQNHDHYQDAACAHHEEHTMHDSVQLNHVADSHADYMSDSNLILYDQYVKDNEVPVVHSNVSYVPNDAFIMIYNDMCEPHAQSVSNPSWNIVVENSLTAKLVTYKEQVELYKRRAKPKPYYNELNKVAIGYKNPLCLTRAKQVQPALYNGHEILKDNHVSVIVDNTEDTLEIAKITRKKINDKMKDLECVTRKVKIVPHDYSKENFLATFTPQKQLTPEQIFWSQDLIKLKSKALKGQTAVSKPIKALTVYPPNTPATLVPRVLPTKSQVKIHILTFIQLFSEFDKTCKKRITPTGLTEGERGFEQTKECYLKEVILFFKTLKYNFEGIQKALTNGIKEMKEVFEELEAEVAQNVVDKKHDAIERKNLLIENDNLIAKCLSKEVFYVATNSELNIARFTEMHVANTIVEARYSFGNNPPTPDKDTPDFDSVFVTGKMQASLQEKDNVIRKLKKQISQLQVTCSDTDRTLNVRTTDSQITKLTEHVANLQAQNDLFKAENDKIKQHYKELNNRDAHLDYLRHLKESIETIQDIVEKAKAVRPLDRSIVSACRYTKHSQELLEYAIGTCPQGSQQRDKQLAHIPLIRKKQTTFAKPSDKSNGNTHKHVAKVKTQKTNVPMTPYTGVNSCTNASGSHPKSNTKKHRISLAKGVNKLPVEDHPRTNKSHLRTSNRVDSSSRLKRTVVHIVLWYLDSGCSKHMMGDRSRLMNFMKKFIGTVRFRNDHFGAIMGYEDYVIGDIVISRVYYVEGLGHNLFFVGKFCDSDLEVAFRKHSCYVRDTDGVELIKGSRGSNLYTISVEDMMKSSPICLLSKASKNKSWLWHQHLNYLNFGTINDLARKDLVRGLPRLKFEKDHLCSASFSPKDSSRTPQQNGVVEIRNCTLVEAARTMLIFLKALMFLWAEVVATAVIGALCYPTNDSEDLGKLQPTADIGIFVGYAPSRKGYRIYNKRTRRIIETIHVQFDELTEPMAPVHLGRGPAPNFLTHGQIIPPTQVVQAPVNSAGTPSSTSIDQDGPSPSISSSSSALQSLSLHQGVTDLEMSFNNDMDFRLKLSPRNWCQLDEQWFDLTKDTLREALQITPVNNNQAFTSPPPSDALINFINELGYSKLVRNLSNVVTNDMFQPWRALTTIINMCLTGKTSGFERPRALKKHKFHPRLDSPLHFPNVEPVLGYLKFSAKGTKREVFRIPIPGSLIIAGIQEASYYQEYLAKVAKHRRYLAGETGSDPDSPAPKPTKTAKKPKPTTPKAHPRPSFSKPVSSMQPKPTSAPAKPQGKKRKLTTEISDKPPKATKSIHGFISKKHKPISTLKSVAEDVPAKEQQVDAKEADMQMALEESLKSMYDVPRGPLLPVVIREPDFRKYQPLLEVPGKGKAKAGPDPGAQAEGQAGPDSGAQDEGQVGSNPDEQPEGQAGPDPVLLKYLNPYQVLWFMLDQTVNTWILIDKPSEADHDKATAETEAESMVSVTIQQDMSLIPPMTSLIIDLTSRPESPKVHQLKATETETTITTTTTTLLLPPYQQQQSTAKAMMMKHIGELEHIMANLIQENKGLEQMIDSHGACLYILEQLDIPH